MSLQVLIIEDEGIIGIHIKRTIISMGYHVLMVVKNAADALKIAKTNKIDLIISDISIDGDMDGIECCNILQTNYNIPVIFVTAYHDLNTLEKASNVDFVGYLIKPFREDELNTMMQLAILKYKLLEKKKKLIINQYYSYSYDENKLFFKDKPIKLTRKENSFLLLLIKAHGALVSYDNIEHNIWQDEQVDDGTRRQLIYRFKQKLQDFPFELIKGLGYKLIIQPSLQH